MAETFRTRFAKIGVAIFVVFSAVAGFFLTLVTPLILLFQMADSKSSYRELGLNLIAMAVGNALLLIGIKKWGQWRYVLVFISIPLIAIVLPIKGESGWIPLILLFVIPFVILQFVQKSYEIKR